MPAKSQAQFRLMKAAENNPKFAKKVGIRPGVAAEYTESNVGKKAYSRLPVKKATGGVALSVGRGEKLPVEQGAGLTKKGRAKYNRETGSNLKAPQPQGGPRRDAFCARMEGNPGPLKDDAGRPTRKAASLKRWNCPGW
jgi:hypothetical protein